MTNIETSTNMARNGSTASSRIPQIDGLRALAMLMVYTYHVWQFGDCPSLCVSLFGSEVNLLGFLNHLTTGVDLFMVLSGFCLFWPLCNSAGALEKWDWQNYAHRRMRRIAPPYYAAIVYAVVLPIVLVWIFRELGMQANWQPVPSLWQFVTHLFFVHTLFRETWNGITGAFWSLGLEAQFYLVFPLVVIGFRRFRLNMIWFMVGMSVLFRIIVRATLPMEMPGWGFILSISFLGRWMQFAAGMLAAWLVAKSWREGNTRSGLRGTALLAGGFALYIVAVQNLVPRALAFLPMADLLLAVAFGMLIIALCTSATPLRAVFGNKILTRLGFISYSIFLIHQPTAWYISEFFKKKLHVSGGVDFLLLSTVGFALVVAISHGFFILFERPFLTMPRRETGTARPSPVPLEFAARESVAHH